MFVDFKRASDFVPSGLDASSWENLRPLYQQLIDRELHCVRCLEKLILDRSELDAAASEALTNLSIAMTCHTDDQAASAAYLEFVERVQPEIRKAGFLLDRKIVTSPFSRDLDALRYGVLLRDLHAGVELFHAENVPLETEISRLDQEYSHICGAMTVRMGGEEMPITRLVRYSESVDRSTREEAFRIAAERRLRDADRIDTIFLHMLKLRHRMAANAGMPGYTTYAFKARRRFDYSPQDCHSYARSVGRVITPLLRRITQDRADALGLSTLRPWDSHVDIHGLPPLRPYTSTDQLVDGVGRMIRRIDPNLGAMFDALRDDPHASHDRPSSHENGRGLTRCLDLEARTGKAPGCYQASRDRQRTPFIFMNAAGVHRDVESLLHEAGHAFHFMLTREEPLLSYRVDIPVEFAEVAAMTMETLGVSQLGEFYSAEDASRARRVQIEQVVHLFSFVAIVDQFQHWMYEREDITPEALHERWTELVLEYGPGFDWAGLEKYLRISWHRVLHIFGMPFYFFEYAIAQMAVLEIGMSYERDPEGTLHRYRKALALGGSRPLPELFRAAGCAFDFSEEHLTKLAAHLEAKLVALD